MPRRAKTKGIYQRGHFWLDWDRNVDGSLRSPYLAIFWYDPERRRIRSTSARSADVGSAKAALDRHYLQNTEGAAICPTCGQRRAGNTGFLVAQAISDYLASHHDLASIDAVRPRLNHVVRYIATLRDPNIRCEQVNEDWIKGFRKWLGDLPRVSSAGNPLAGKRTASTVENSVLQLAAAINAAHDRGDTSRPAQFKPIATKELNRTPQHRADLDQLVTMFRYAAAPTHPVKRAALHRFLIVSVATLCRPDAAHDLSLAIEKDQWNSDRRVLKLNPRDRRQTRKYRATVRIPYQVAPWFDRAAELVRGEPHAGTFVDAKSVRSAWDTMAEEIGLPADGEAGMKLIRRSMAQMLRDRGVGDEQIEMQLGHRKLDSVSELYAPFKPDYLKDALTAIEAVIDDIEAHVPGAFHRTDTGEIANIIPLRA